jgi:hypothetical protein
VHSERAFIHQRMYQVGTVSEENFLTGTTAFDRLERLAQQVGSREQTSRATQQVHQETLQRQKRYEQMHFQAMAAFARTELALGRMRQRYG